MVTPREGTLETPRPGGLQALRFAVIGAGAVGNEVVKNLVLAGAGHIDVYDDAVVAPTDLGASVFLRQSDVGSSRAQAVVRHAAELGRGVRLRAIDGEFRRLVSLTGLMDYQVAICTVDRIQARLDLSELCLIAGVNFLAVASEGHTARVESFPFAVAWGGACYECEPADTARHANDAVQHHSPVTGTSFDSIDASIAGLLAVSTALDLATGTGSAYAVRVRVDLAHGAMDRTPLQRNRDCPRCRSLDKPPTVIRTRNRWSLAPELAAIGAPSLGQQLLLSDRLIVRYECASCGQPDEAARYLNRRAADFDDSIRRCPRCWGTSVRIEVQDSFELGELVRRFGGDAVPAKYALADIAGRTVCFDLEG